MSRSRLKVALVTHSINLGGGAATMAAYLYESINRSSGYEADMISLAMGSSDQLSRRLRNPSTWSREPRIERRMWREIPYVQVGGNWVEYEPCRYWPRPVLTNLLKGYDLIQVVGGTPPWLCPVLEARRPSLLWTASTLWADRASRVMERTGAGRMVHRYLAWRAQHYEKLALEQAGHVFALSPYTVKAIQQITPNVKPELAICGVDTVHYQPAPARDKRNYILSVARFEDARKNVNLLLQAYRQLVDQRPDAPDLYLVGDKPSMASRKRLAELNLQDRVHLAGPVDGRRLAELYAQAKFFVLSSDEEGLGIVLLEAMASGLPVISTRSGGPEVVIEDQVTGYLTPVREVEPLVAAMERLAGDPSLREAMGKLARRRVERMFSVEATQEIFLRKYDEVLGQPRGVPVYGG
ncbi:MAG: glycosyltransferase family 4 protein [Bryobacterales bacterium]|nr:glycosyltransferase family 4 protein [Bryobacterales bacterium]